MSYRFTLGNIEFSYTRATPFIIHMERLSDGAYDCIEINFTFDSQHQFEEYVRGIYHETQY